MKNIIKNIKNYLLIEDVEHKKTNKITYFSMIQNLGWGIIKILFGIILSDYFWCISGLFTMDIGLCKFIYRKRRLKSNHELIKEIPYYRYIGICLAIGSIIYIMYMGRLLLFDVETKTYDSIEGITIATFAFLDLGLAIKNFIVSNKKHDFLLSGLRLVGIVSALTAIVLTQVALLSFSSKSLSTVNQSNGFMGVGFGVICLFISCFMIVYSIIKQHKIVVPKEI